MTTKWNVESEMEMGLVLVDGEWYTEHGRSVPCIVAEYLERCREREAAELTVYFRASGYSAPATGPSYSSGGEPPEYDEERIVYRVEIDGDAVPPAIRQEVAAWMEREIDACVIEP